MRILTTAVILAACAASFGTTAMAGTARLTDSQFIKAARCRGLAGSAVLSGDKAAYDTILNSQRLGRDLYTRERADKARSQAERQAKAANEETKQALSAELSGACATLLS